MLEWIWVKHIPFKHMKVECLFLWGSTHLPYSIFKWKCLLIIISCLRICIHYMLLFLKSLIVLCWWHCNLYFVFHGKWISALIEDEQKLLCKGEKGRSYRILSPFSLFSSFSLISSPISFSSLWYSWWYCVTNFALTIGYSFMPIFHDFLV